MATLGHGIAGIGHEIHDYLLNLSWIRFDASQGRR